MQNDDWTHGSLFGKGWANGYDPDGIIKPFSRLVNNLGTDNGRIPWDFRMFFWNAESCAAPAGPLDWSDFR